MTALHLLGADHPAGRAGEVAGAQAVVEHGLHRVFDARGQVLTLRCAPGASPRKGWRPGGRVLFCPAMSGALPWMGS